MIQEVLEHSGLNFRLHVIGDGQDALTYLQGIANSKSKPCPSLVLLDLNIPKINGIEVLKWLRDSSRCSHVKVVAVSSSDSQSDRDAVQKLGVQGYFRKPTDFNAYMELAKLIKQVLA